MEYTFSIENIFKDLPSFSSKGITELAVVDENFSHDKNGIAKFCDAVTKYCPELFVSLKIDSKIIDSKLIEKLSSIYVSLEIPLTAVEKNGTLLFDKKYYSSKANLLNDAGLVWGFDLSFGVQSFDTFKAFRERLDFAVGLYPNHIDFPQLENKTYICPKSTGVYSSKDLDFSRGMAFACKTFYTAGRSVPWFNSITKALKITASNLFSDFEEWQLCNNCSYEAGFVPEECDHKKIEEMQLKFLEQKFAEKNRGYLFECAGDIIKINGAFSRVSETGQEEVVELNYDAEDLLSPYSMDINAFHENVPMKLCRIKVIFGDEGVDFKSLS